MSTPYSGASAAGPPQGYAEPTQQNYAADYSGSMGTPTTEAGRPDVEGTSVGQLMGEVAKDLSTLMRQELELAKVEVKAEAKKAGAGAGLFGVAGFAGYMVLMFVAILWGIVGAVAGLMGKKKFQQVNPKPERTVETLQQVPGALKPN